MFKALNDLFIIIYELKQRHASSLVTRVKSGTAIIMNTYTSKVKITTIDNGARNLQESRKPTFEGCRVSLCIDSYLLFGRLHLWHLCHRRKLRGNVHIRNRR
jgi:hypothetical protein